jgi:hypothetical protein
MNPKHCAVCGAKYDASTCPQCGCADVLPPPATATQTRRKREPNPE